MRVVGNLSTAVVRPVLLGALVAVVGLSWLPSASWAGGHQGHAAPAEAAPVTVQGAWIRPTVQGQAGTGGFMTLRAQRDMTLVGFRSPSAAQAELHEMKMEGDIMRMRAIQQLALPAGQDVTLRPGGYHLMLIGLTQPLPAGQEVALELLLKDAAGKPVVQSLKVMVRSSAPAGQDKGDATGAHHHHH